MQNQKIKNNEIEMWEFKIAKDYGTGVQNIEDNTSSIAYAKRSNAYVCWIYMCVWKKNREREGGGRCKHLPDYTSRDDIGSQTRPNTVIENHWIGFYHAMHHITPHHTTSYCVSVSCKEV